VAAIDDSTAAPAYFDGVFEAGGCQLIRYPARHGANRPPVKCSLLQNTEQRHHKR
jgi:hypothetical protein